MGKLKRKKLANALGRMLKKQDKKQEKERKIQAHNDNLEKAKQNQIKPKVAVKKAAVVKSIRPNYSSKDTILLIGEGNFSFAKSLCENYLEEGAENLTATCYDTEEVLYQKYEEAKENVELVRSFGGTVLFEVDGTDLPKEVKKNKYTKIIFNFPHIGAGIKDQDRNVIANQKLLNGFFDAAEPLLTRASTVEIPAEKSESRTVEIVNIPDGEIHVTLKTCKPYNLWAVKSLVKAKDVLAIKKTAPFYPDHFPGYEHRRTLGFKEGLSKGGNAEILSSEPKTYTFVRKEVMSGEIQKVIEGSKKRKLEVLKAQMGKKVKKHKTEKKSDDDDDDE